MTNSERLLEIIRDLDTFIAQLKADGQDGYAHLVQVASEDLMWLYHSMTEDE